MKMMIVEIVIGLFALGSVIYKLVQCPSCDDKILWFSVPGFVYILFWSAISTVLFYQVYRGTRIKKEKDTK